MRAREARIRDLGGLLLEMYRQDRFREDLVAEQCAELLDLEARIHELDSLLAAAGAGGARVPSNRCVCGAPLLWGAHFCAHCGRATADAPLVVCAHCGHPLPAGVQFCGACGTPTGVEPQAAADDASVEAPAGAADDGDNAQATVLHVGNGDSSPEAAGAATAPEPERETAAPEAGER